MLFGPWQVGLPSPSSWVHALSYCCGGDGPGARACPLASLFPEAAVMVRGQHSSKHLNTCHFVACMTHCSPEVEMPPKPPVLPFSSPQGQSPGPCKARSSPPSQCLMGLSFFSLQLPLSKVRLAELLPGKWKRLPTGLPPSSLCLRCLIN